MTKIRNTKKGMAKKTLSISLAVAMLATSNVPVWAAEFTDGSAVEFTSEAPAEVVEEAPVEVIEEAPIIEENEAIAAEVVTEGDITVNLTQTAKSVVWGDGVTIGGEILNGSTKLDKWNYVWKDEDGLSAGTAFEGKNVDTVSAMNLPKDNKDLSGKTLTLWIYRNDAAVNVNIETNVVVTVNKRSLQDVATTSTTLTYNGFEQDLSAAKFVVKDIKKQNVTVDDYTVDSFTSAIEAGEKVSATITAKADSAYIGTAVVTAEIAQKTYSSEYQDIVADVEEGLEFQYTGDFITVPSDKVTLKESQSTNNGTDHKLNGRDLSAAITEAKTVTKVVGDSVAVKVSADKNEIKNITGVPASYTTTKTVKITKRDLQNNTTINVTGDIPVGTSVSSAALLNYLNFTDGDTKLKLLATDFDVTAVNEKGDTVTTLKDAGNYTLTITGKNNAKNSQEISVYVATSVITASRGSKFASYKKDYTGTAIEPGKDAIGDLYIKVNYENNKEILIQNSQWEITGYTNNVDASRYDGNGTLVPGKCAYVNIRIVDGNYEGKTLALPFEISPLEVVKANVTVPGTISFNEKNTEAKDYAVPVTVVAKSEDKKVSKTLTEADFTVTYDFKDAKTGTANGKNELHQFIETTVTVTNPNYILGSNDGKTVKTVAAGRTELVAKSLTDSMITVNPSSYTYTGGTIVPEFVVMDGVYPLYEDEDYVVENLFNAVNVGTGKVVIKGINDNYYGTAEATFEITPADTASVKVEVTPQPYTGRQVRPKYTDANFTVTLNGNNVKSQFEVVEYGENVKAGKGTVTLAPVVDNKNFTGKNITVEFDIVNELVKGTISVYDEYGIELTGTPTFDFDGTEKTFVKELLKNLRKTNATGGDEGTTKATADDFEIKYVDNVCGKYNGSKNVAYVYAVAKEGTGYAGSKQIVAADGTVIKGVVASRAFHINTVAFAKENITVTNATYAGGLPVKPEVLIQIGGNTLVEGRDYTVKVTGGNFENNYVDVTNSKIYGLEVKGIGGYTKSGTISLTKSWGIDKKNLNDCNVTVKDGVATVTNGALPVPTTEYETKDNGDGTYTVTAVKTSKNYVGSKTVTGEGLVDNKPAAPMLVNVKVDGNKATAVLSGESEGAIGYDYVIGTSRDCIETKDYVKVNKNKLTTDTTFTYVQQGQYYAYCHAWTRDENGKKVFSEWSNAYPFVVTAITPDTPVITGYSVKGNTVTVTYTKAKNADGYDVVLGSTYGTVADEKRPLKYGELVKKNINGNTVTATFKNVPAGTYYAGLHAFNRTSEDGKKVFSPWSNIKTIKVK